MKTISHHIIDIVHNSIRGESEEILIAIEESENKLKITIKDNGKGIEPDLLKDIDDPYATTRSSRNIGMGIPLIKFHALQTEGEFSIDSIEGSGTTLKAIFTIDHLDRQPMGDLAGSVTQLFCSVNDCDIILDYKTDKDQFNLSLSQLKEIFGDIPLSSPGVYSNIKELIESQLEGIDASS